jgi:hypothetical protein
MTPQPPGINSVTFDNHPEPAPNHPAAPSSLIPPPSPLNNGY